MTARVVWTGAMTRALRELRARRVPLLLCAERIGVSYRQAVCKARALGLAARLNRGRAPGHAVRDPLAARLAQGLR